MKLLRPLITILLCSLSVFKIHGQIMEVIESDRGNVRTISKTDKQIVEINSSLEVSIFKTELLKAIKDAFPQYSEQVELEEKINALSEALNNQEAILNSLKQGVENVESQQEFFMLMDTFLIAVQSNAHLSEKYEELNEEYFSLPNYEDLNLEEYVFSGFSDDLLKHKEILKGLDANAYKISLVAFKKDKNGGDRVHIENFDTYSEREHVTIDRWVTSLSEEQREKLDQLQEKAKENNEKAISVFQELKDTFSMYMPDIECVEKQKEALLNFLNDPQIIQNLNESIENQGNDLAKYLNKFLRIIDAFNSDIASWSIYTPFELGDQLKDFVSYSKEMALKFKDFQTLANQVVALQPQVLTLANDFTECYKEIETYVKGLKETLSLLKIQQKNYLASKEIGSEVQVFGVDNLPNKGFINLKGTGTRANGDELLIEVLLRIPSGQEGLPDQSFVLEQRTFYMQLLGARTEVAVGMIMANPINKDNLSFDPERKFFFSPAASLLLKFGSKKSYFYNEFIDFGVGVNFATPDFDTDGALEFGTGLIVTGFKDILSLGMNYNVTLDAPYWFFGVNLPFNLPGVPINKVQN